MFHVLLVDDELSVTDALQCSINWGALGLTVSAVAQSGEQALACIESTPIDIVITDIRMANIDGLSLCQRISKMERSIQTIIISGFAEFSYAQKALSYGALGYCLKPLEYDELKRHLQRAVHQLRQNSQTPDHDDLLDALQNADSGEFARTLTYFGLRADVYYAAVCVGKAPLPLSPQQKRISLRLGYRQDAYISTEPFAPENVHAYLQDAQSRGLSFTEEGCSADDLPRTIQKLNNSAFQFFVEPESKLFSEKQEDHAAPVLREIAQAAAQCDAARTAALLDAFHGEAGRMFTLRSVWCLYTILSSSDAFGAAFSTDNIYSPEQLVFQFKSFSTLLAALQERVSARLPPPGASALSNASFLQMINYIDTHYDRGLSLGELAREMNLNANYLSQVFKKETGKTFLKYITDLRIEKAKKMLDSGEHSIGEIASALGFNDYFYFLKTFKRVTGLTPKQYKHGYAAPGVTLPPASDP